MNKNKKRAMKVVKNKPVLRLYNSFSKEKENFCHPRHVEGPDNKEKSLSLYVCGITPYDYAHIGHGRCYVHFDVVHRTLKFFGHEVTYVRNITDIDDKILKKAESFVIPQKNDVIPACPESACPETLRSVKSEESQDPGLRQDDNMVAAAIDVAHTFTNAFNEDMTALGCGSPDHQPTVSGHSQQIINFIQGLLDNGSAYQAGHDIYFDTTSYAAYGQLARRVLDEQEEGVRVALSADKRNPHDFVLWKGNGEGRFWRAPWGFGRPGWHIECSTFVKEYLGDTIDIHGGGADLLFPHHENERAQSESLTGKPFVRHWLHNAHVTLNKEKMSKSTGNFFTLRDIFKQFDPMVLRFYFLQHHYRTPLDFTHEHVASAEKAYRRLVKGLNSAVIPERNDVIPACPESPPHVIPACPESACPETLRSVKSKESGDPGQAGVTHEFLLDALSDDFNTPKLLGLVFAHLEEIIADPQLHAVVLQLLQNVLGLSCQPFAEKEQEVTAQITDLIQKRADARAAKDWATADKIRDQLNALGFEVMDRK